MEPRHATACDLQLEKPHVHCNEDPEQPTLKIFLIKKKKTDHTKSVEEVELSYSARENVKWYNHLGKWFDGFLKR